MTSNNELGSTEPRIDRGAMALGLMLLGTGICRTLTANKFLDGIPDQALVNVVAGAFGAGGLALIGNEIRKVIFR